MLQVGDLLCSAWVRIWIHETHECNSCQIAKGFYRWRPSGILIHPGPWALLRPPGAPVTRSRPCAIPVRFLLDSSVFFYFWLHAQEHQQQHQLLLQHPIRGPIPGPPPLFRAPLLSALIFFSSKPKFKFYIILLMDLCACLHDLSKNIYRVLTQAFFLDCRLVGCCIFRLRAIAGSLTVNNCIIVL